jgi:hypothetical protein
MEAALVLESPTGLKDDAKHESEDGQHEQWRQERPGEAEVGAAVAAKDVAFGELEDELALGPEASSEGDGVEESDRLCETEPGSNRYALDNPIEKGAHYASRDSAERNLPKTP